MHMLTMFLSEVNSESHGNVIVWIVITVKHILDNHPKIRPTFVNVLLPRISQQFERLTEFKQICGFALIYPIIVRGYKIMNILDGGDSPRHAENILFIKELKGFSLELLIVFADTLPELFNIRYQ